ncbi:MAG: hypothetical protein LBQ67_01800, partial [Treponema sp.]|nr:hypothetical protein [Treponema sp.]
MKNLFITILFKITPLLFCWTFFSCAATPPAPAGFEPPAESAVTVDESGIADASGGAAGEGPADEIPGVDLPPGEEEPDEAAEELDEPFVDLPETAEALAPPPE